MILLWHGNYSSGAVLDAGLSHTFSLARLCFSPSVIRVVFSLQTLSNLLAALREEDFSMRARGRPAATTPWAKVNDRGQCPRRSPRQQRLGALEANALLRTVMEEIDLAVFTFRH